MRTQTSKKKLALFKLNLELKVNVKIIYLAKALTIVSGLLTLYNLFRGFLLSFLTSSQPNFLISKNILLSNLGFLILSSFKAESKLNQFSLFFTHNFEYAVKSQSGSAFIVITSYITKTVTFIYFIDYLYSNLKMKDIIVDLETLDLNPVNSDSRIVAIGVRCGKYENVLMHRNERILLKKFFALPFFQERFRLIGFNSFSFDFPYLIIRSFKYGLKIPDIRGKTIDLRYVLSYGNKMQKGKLIDYGQLILGELGNKYQDLNGDAIYGLWKSGRHDLIKEYCLQDTRITYTIYERLKYMGIL